MCIHTQKDPVHTLHILPSMSEFAGLRDSNQNKMHSVNFNIIIKVYQYHAISTPLPWILIIRAIKGYSHSFRITCQCAQWVCSRAESYTKAMNNNNNQHWNRFKCVVAETSERPGGAHTDFSERTDTILNWTVYSVTERDPERSCRINTQGS